MSQRRFFVAGDDWGLVEIIPAENAQQYERVKQQVAEHHKDTAFSPNGWTTPPFIIPPPEVPLSAREIPLSELGEVFGGLLVRAAVVETCEDLTGKAFEALGCFAWGAPQEFRAGFYGNAPTGIVDTLLLSEWRFDEGLAGRLGVSLARFGAKYRLLLVSHGCCCLALEDQERLTVFLGKGFEGLCEQDGV